MNEITSGKKIRNSATSEGHPPEKKQKTSEQRFNYFDILPDEMLFKIFQYSSPLQFLDLQLTCKRFHSHRESFFTWVANVWKIQNDDKIIQNFYKKIFSTKKNIPQNFSINTLTPQIQLPPIQNPTIQNGPTQLPPMQILPNDNQTFCAPPASALPNIAPIDKVNALTPIPMVFNLYQEQIDRDTVIVANEIAKQLGIDTFSTAEKARDYLNASENKNLLVTIQELHLMEKDLRYLPTEISKLTALQKLNLGNNLLTELPLEIAEFTALRELYIENNKLTDLPPGFSQLVTLESLSLENNKLRALPADFGNLIALEELILNGNPQLKELPSSFDNLTALQELYIDKNLEQILPQQMIERQNPDNFTIEFY
ncbi:MAG: hypothetical protein K1000chlam3_01376 [Chlamydiae bacterium]|nr:hypothetical protein [Chlamydiota bacterium]